VFLKQPNPFDVGFYTEKPSTVGIFQRSRIGIPTGYGLEELRGRSSSPARVKNFLFSTLSRSALGFTQPPIQRVPGALSPGVKRPGREADHSPPASAEVKKMWVYTFTPPYVYMA
jgi:hypothetical protein